ncbi:hypothetical protein [Streptomyces sp. WM4235]|nr:hypothetical protein [Streptomyces sp. WM4235]
MSDDPWNDGGFLQPRWVETANQTGEPEPVLTIAQWRALTDES